MQVDRNNFNSLIDKPIIFVLFRSTSSTKHASLWEEIKSQSEVLVINTEENKDLISFLNLRILPVVHVYINGEIDKVFTLKNISKLKDYVNSKTN